MVKVRERSCLSQINTVKVWSWLGNKTRTLSGLLHRSNVLHTDPPPQPPRPDFLSVDILDTVLPAFSLNVGIGCKLCSAVSSTMDVIPRILGWKKGWKKS